MTNSCEDEDEAISMTESIERTLAEIEAMKGIYGCDDEEQEEDEGDAAAAADAAAKMNSTNNQETLDAKDTEEFIKFFGDNKIPKLIEFFNKCKRGEIDVEEYARNSDEEIKKQEEDMKESHDELKKKLDALKKKERSVEYAKNQLSELEEDSEDDADRLFPKSEFYVHQETQEIQLSKVNSSIYFSPNNKDDPLLKKWIHSAVETGCIHSMKVVASSFISEEINEGRNIGDHFTRDLTVPWCLEGSIRGSIKCVRSLELVYLLKAKPHRPEALIVYWGKMKNKYTEWNGSLDTTKQFKSKNAKLMKDNAEKACVICHKVDTDTLTLRQCSGCSMYCYCSDVCQTIQWERGNHRSECKQIQILNKNHKPYAKEIRKAAIRGETHPALEKLRSKLGLSRPIEDYQEFADDKTHNGKLIDSGKYFVGREDGTVWIGSTPSPIGPFSNTAITTTSREDDVFRSSTQTPPPTGGFGGGDVSDGGDNGTLAESDDDGYL